MNDGGSSRSPRSNCFAYVEPQGLREVMSVWHGFLNIENTRDESKLPNMKHFKTTLLRYLTIFAVFPSLAASANETTSSMIKLNKPDTTGGLPVMQALANRASAHEWSDKALPLQDLSNLLWAANGINRPDSGKRTAPSALNAQDVDVYVFTTENVYIYDAKAHALVLTVSGDQRAKVGLDHGNGKQPVAPVELVLVSNGNKFPFGTPEQRREWGDIDIGIVSQNIGIFCAGTGLATRPRASVDSEALHKLLNLADGQRAILDHPVGYSREK
jgi:hypothetical protein